MTLQVDMRRGSELQFREMQQASIYEAILNILGATGTIVPLGDRRHGQPNATTLTTVGGEQITFTWSESPDGFDTPLDLGDEASYQGIIPVITFNGSNEELDTSDADYWSRGDGSNDSPVTIIMWVLPTDTAALRSLLSKWYTSNPTREWSFAFDGSDKLYFGARDDSAGVNVTCRSDAAVTMGEWVCVGMTYDGAGGASAMDTVSMYVNGALVPSTAANNGSYVAMENAGGKVSMGVRDGSYGHYPGKIAGGPLGPAFTQIELTADQMLRVYEIGRRALAQ